MKCDDCSNRTGYTLGPDECGAGSFFEYCSKGHWDGSGPQSKAEEKLQNSMPDPWIDCKDYKVKWLDAPDSEGWWTIWLKGALKPHVDYLFEMDGVWYYSGVVILDLKDMKNMKFQKIPAVESPWGI